MGCFPSKRVSDVDERREHKLAELRQAPNLSECLSCSTESAEEGRLGILPLISISSDEWSEERIMDPYGLVGKLAVGIQEISDDSEPSVSESSIESNTANSSTHRHQVDSRENQSMDDVGESVVDWLAESNTTVFTSTTVDDAIRQQSYSKTKDKDFPPEKKDFIITISRSSSLNDTVASAPNDDKNLSVKNTYQVSRRHAPLPSNDATKGDWLLNRYVVNDYIVLFEIGKGAHSEVRLCKHKKNNSLYALKIMNRKLLQSKIVDIQKEVSIMKQIRHKNCLRLYEVLDDPTVNKVYLVVEFAHQGDLMKLLKRDPGALTDEVLRDVSRQVMEGLAFLHQNNVVHNDLKPSNILITGDGTVKISDFGISGTGRVRLDSAGTPSFMAPEVVTGEAFDGQSADCYSLGATMFCLKYGRTPFVGKGGHKKQQLVDLYDQIRHAPLLFPDPVDPMLKDLISKLMAKDPSNRIRLIDALEHPWLK